MRALLLVDHGSRRADANAVLEELAELVRARTRDVVRTAHLELAPPTIAEGFDACVAAGANEVVVVPVFLAPGRHASEDVPRLAREAAERLGVAWRVADVLGADPLLAELVLARAHGAPPERYVLYRQDDHGHRFAVERFDSLTAAREALARFEEGTHEQCYWLEREPRGPTVERRNAGPEAE
ncbi:MAG TPA: CbiX/SirB N-terminal domain-containing protein [Sandaracinaceae bacterium]